MSTSLVQPNDRLKDIDMSREITWINSRHRDWVDEFLATGLNGEAACKKVGYKTPHHLKTREMLQRPIIRTYIEQQLAILREQQWVRREQLLNKIQRLNDFNLMKVGTRAKGGYIEINLDDYERVADEIGDCVTEVEVKQDSVRIRLMDKDKMFDRELKYYGILDMDGKVNININAGQQGMNWDELCNPPTDEDVVEGRTHGS